VLFFGGDFGAEPGQNIFELFHHTTTSQLLVLFRERRGHGSWSFPILMGAWFWRVAGSDDPRIGLIHPTENPARNGSTSLHDEYFRMWSRGRAMYNNSDTRKAFCVHTFCSVSRATLPYRFAMCSVHRVQSIAHGPTHSAPHDPPAPGLLPLRDLLACGWHNSYW